MKVHVTETSLEPLQSLDLLQWASFSLLQDLHRLLQLPISGKHSCLLNNPETTLFKISEGHLKRSNYYSYLGVTLSETGKQNPTSLFGVSTTTVLRQDITEANEPIVVAQ
jgi:hypothetical protein